MIWNLGCDRADAGLGDLSSVPDTLRYGSPEEVGFEPVALTRAVNWVRESLVSTGRIPGAQLLVARKGVIVAHSSFGLIDVEDGRKMIGSSLLWIASLTKPFTATAVMTLVDRGKISLGDRVGRYLPRLAEFRVPTRSEMEGRHITIQQLLSHTSGLGRTPRRASESRSSMGSGWLDQPISATADSIASEVLQFEPGTDWEYSNAGYVLLGRIIEVVTGTEFGQNVRQNVFDPLGLESLFWMAELGKDLESRIANVYRERDGSRTPSYFIYEPEFSYLHNSPSGGLFGNVLAVAKLAQMFLNGGRYGGKQVLRPATVDLMLSNHTPGMSVRWGLGWALEWPTRSDGGGRRGRCVFAHTGSAGTMVMVDRDLELMALLFFQLADDRGTRQAIQDEFLHLVYGALATESLRDALAQIPVSC